VEFRDRSSHFGTVKTQVVKKIALRETQRGNVDFLPEIYLSKSPSTWIIPAFLLLLSIDQAITMAFLICCFCFCLRFRLASRIVQTRV
jgi:hypothetical protein